MKLFTKLSQLNDKIALVQNKKKFRYSDFAVFSERISKIIKKDSIVILLAKNEIESLAFYVASINNGYCLIILDENSEKDFIVKTIKNFKSNYIFYPKNLNYFKKNSNKKFIFSSYCLEQIDTKLKKYNNSNSIILTTSGTTSSPKFVRLSNKNLYINSKQIINYLKIKKSHKTITTLPMAYSYGLSIINSHLECGSTVVINNEPAFSKLFWEKLKNFNITSFGTVPAVYDYLKRIKFENFISSSSLKYLTVAGGKVGNNTLNYLLNVCRTKKIKFFVMYGQTEASPRMSYYELTKYPKKIGSIGKPIKGTKFEILKKELIFHGKNASLGYAINFKDLKKNDINKGKIHTGDLGFLDKDGFYYLTGRKKKISKIFGLRIDLEDIEKTLNQKNYNVKALVDDKKIKIQSFKACHPDKIKEIIFKKYKINKNFIEIIIKENLKGRIISKI